MNRMPSQNDGVARPASDITRITKSIGPFCFKAEIIRVGITSSSRFMMYRYIAFLPAAPPSSRSSPRLADKTVLRRDDAFDRLAGERSLIGCSGGVFQMFEGRNADERGGNCVVRDDEAYRQLDQCVGKALANQRFEPPGALDVDPVRGTRADRLDTGGAERMPLLGSAQGAGGEHADRDDAHVGSFGVRQQIAEIMCRVTWCYLRSGA